MARTPPRTRARPEKASPTGFRLVAFRPSFRAMNESTSENRSVTRLVTADEREESVKRLSAAFADDTIPVAEFERRVAEVYRVETPQALQEITRDLPATRPEASAVPVPVDPPAPIARRPSQQFSAVLGSTERSVQGPLPERLDVRAVMGSVELDLRRAEFPAGVTEIHVRSILGNVELELPAHVQVESHGHAFLANFSVDGRTRNRGDGDAPIVRITGRSIFANVEVELDD
jgi:hypothetical protein